MKSQHSRLLMVVGIVTLIDFCAGAQTNHGIIEFKADLKNDSDILDARIDSSLIGKVPFDAGFCEQIPAFPSGEEALLKFISKSIKYPTEATKNGIEGKVIVQFSVRKTGKVENVIVLSGVSKALDAEAIRVVSSLPDFIPGKSNGVNVDMYYTLPVLFQLSPKVKKDVPNLVEKMPQFPGGDKALIEFIGKNLKLAPMADCEHGIPGAVYLRFIVTKKGTITNVQVVRSLDPACDKEAIRIAKLFPKWIPGEQNGQKVDVYYTLPVSFNPNNYGK